MSTDHRLPNRRRVEAQDVAAGDPVPPQRMDFIREVLKPTRITLRRRTAELTIAILQLVASRRGIGALPSWVVKNYVDHDHATARRIGVKGLWGELYGVAERTVADSSYAQDFVALVREKCAAELDGIKLL